MVASVPLTRLKTYLIIHEITLLDGRFLLLLYGVPMEPSSRLQLALV